MAAYPFASHDDGSYERARSAEAVSRRRRFENLLARHERRLRRVAFGMLGDPHRVDDVLQEAFVRAYRSLPDHFDSADREAAWLYRIVHRSCLNELRSRRRSRESLGLPEELIDVRGVTADSVAIAAALAQLSVEGRAVVLLVDVVGLDYDTAAAALQVPRGTVASRLNTARAALRELLDA